MGAQTPSFVSGWGGRTRTPNIQNQNLTCYHLHHSPTQPVRVGALPGQESVSLVRKRRKSRVNSNPFRRFSPPPAASRKQEAQENSTGKSPVKSVTQAVPTLQAFFVDHPVCQPHLKLPCSRCNQNTQPDRKMQLNCGKSVLYPAETASPKSRRETSILCP